MTIETANEASTASSGQCARIRLHSLPLAPTSAASTAPAGAVTAADAARCGPITSWPAARVTSSLRRRADIARRGRGRGVTSRCRPTTIVHRDIDLNSPVPCGPPAAADHVAHHPATLSPPAGVRHRLQRGGTHAGPVHRPGGGSTTRRRSRRTRRRRVWRPIPAGSSPSTITRSLSRATGTGAAP